MRKKSIFVYILLLLAVVCAACFGAYQYFFGALEHDSSFENAVDNAVDRLAVNEQTDFNNADIKTLPFSALTVRTAKKAVRTRP